LQSCNQTSPIRAIFIKGNGSNNKPTPFTLDGITYPLRPNISTNLIHQILSRLLFFTSNHPEKVIGIARCFNQQRWSATATAQTAKLFFSFFLQVFWTVVGCCQFNPLLFNGVQ
jgi:hypothetical protein